MIFGNIPSLSKHDESTQHWFIFGRSPLTGRVDLNDGTNDVGVALTVEDAEKLIAARDRFIEEVRKICASFNAQDE